MAHLENTESIQTKTQLKNMLAGIAPCKFSILSNNIYIFTGDDLMVASDDVCGGRRMPVLWEYTIRSRKEITEEKSWHSERRNYDMDFIYDTLVSYGFTQV